eukprot:TRINITY_DN11281_c0_g1_i1.p1 TRINITY_DN11281_c0_g1~~TRINITY_DN11281_c0_g1_i1.p1  ORF type:complete len:492 (-),score=183.90 TRINITY_DN11281_c0_g1_i1:389-1864(-)
MLGLFGKIGRIKESGKLLLNFSRSMGSVSMADIDLFKSYLGENNVITDPDELRSANTDWMKQYFGNSPVILRPKTTAQVSAIMRHCDSVGLKVVPQGGNTGLVGGSVPVADEVILSMSNMRDIISFDENSGIVVCDAGCILQNVDDWLREKDHIFPLDLGAKGSCHVGGVVATNAGGLRLLRYGSLHGSVMGLEVVKADGTVLDLLKELRKDNTGYDMKQLFIGSEGTLGVITKVAVACPAKSNSVQLAMLACPSFDAVRKVVKKARTDLGEILSAVEFLENCCLEMEIEQLGVRSPFESKSAYYMMIESSGSNNDHDVEKMSTFLEEVMEEGLVEDGTLAQSEQAFHELWALREDITLGLAAKGHMYKHDVSLPMQSMADVLEAVREKLDGKAEVFGYGHLGDGNLHLNAVTSEYEPGVKKIIDDQLYSMIADLGGSVSAEHGIGQMKVNKIQLSKSQEVLRSMADVKKVMDPNNTLNPGKVIPPEFMDE